MSYRIEKNADKKSFIVEYNHNQGLELIDGAEVIEGAFVEFTYALLPNEIMHTEQAEVEVDVLDYETRIETYEEPIFDENGEITGYNTIEQEVQVPIMVTVEEVVLVPVFDKEGNFIGEEEQTITREVQSTHKEIRIVTLCYPIVDVDYEAKQAQKERERIAKLKLTKREVFLGLYQAKGVTPDMIKAQITDAQALIEFEYANDYYRGNPLIDIVGATLGITPKQLDKFFETNDYTVLLPIDEVIND